LQAVGTRTFQVFPMLIAACLWYIALCSVLMVGQHFLEKRFSRGRRTTQREAAPVSPGPDEGGGDE